MKKIFFAYISLSLLFLTLSCDKELPYPIKDVKRGVLIDVVRMPSTEGVLTDGLTTGNYKVKLTIPENQGDYSFMKNAQLLAVLQDVNGSRSSQVIMDNITQFPAEISLNLSDIYKKFGQTVPTARQILFITANVVLNDGTVIPGWTALTGFNNVAFAGWQVDGRAYSSNVRYAVVCPFDPDLSALAGDYYFESPPAWGDEGDVVLEADPTNPYKIYVKGLAEVHGLISNGNKLELNFNPVDFSVSGGPRVILATAAWQYTNFAMQAVSGSFDSCTNVYSVSITISVAQGTFGTYACKFTKQ